MEHLAATETDISSGIDQKTKIIIHFVLFAADTTVALSEDKLNTWMCTDSTEIVKMKNWFNTNELTPNIS